MTLDREDRLGKLWTDMYVGDGEINRPMTVRMATVEGDVADVDKRIDKIVGNITKLFWSFLAAALALVVDILVHKATH